MGEGGVYPKTGGFYPNREVSYIKTGITCVLLELNSGGIEHD